MKIDLTGLEKIYREATISDETLEVLQKILQETADAELKMFMKRFEKKKN